MTLMYVISVTSLVTAGLALVAVASNRIYNEREWERYRQGLDDEEQCIAAARAWQQMVDTYERHEREMSVDDKIRELENTISALRSYRLHHAHRLVQLEDMVDLLNQDERAEGAACPEQSVGMRSK